MAVASEIGAHVGGNPAKIGTKWYNVSPFFIGASAAVLALSFRGNRYAENQVVEDFGDTMTFDRDSDASLENAQGLIDFVSTDEARFDWSTNQQGIFIEEEVTNLITNPKTVGGSGWSNYNASVTTNNDIAPDGTQTATRFVATGQYANTTQQPTATASTAYTGSMWVKVISDNGSSPVLQVYDGTTYKNVAIDKTKTGWVRYDVGFTIGGSANFFRLQITDSGSANWTELSLWFGQVNEGALVRSETEGTKEADDLNISGSDFSGFYNQSEGTFVVDFKIPDKDTQTANVIEINSGSQFNRYLLNVDGSNNKVILSVIVGGAFQGNLTSQILGDSGRIRAVFGYKNNDFVLSVNGEAVITASHPVFTASRVDIGKSVANSNYLNGVVYDVAYYDTRITDAEAQELSRGYVNYTVEGDSYGADHIYPIITKTTSFDRVARNSAVGGSTLEQAVARAEAFNLSGERPMIFCDGSPNGFDTVANDLARYQRVIDATDGKVVIVSPVVHPTIVGGSFETFCDDMTEELLAQSWGAKVVNGTQVAEDLAGTTDRTSTAYDDVFNADGVHPSDELTTALINAALGKF